jgi:hypothetical protein
VKLWYAVLTKGFGLVTSIVGGVSVIAPWIQPLTPKVLSGYMTAWTIVLFIMLTFSATSLRISSNRPRPGAATLCFTIAVVALIAFLWLLDAVPHWPLLDTRPRVARGIATFPYGLMIGSLCAGLALLIPDVPPAQVESKKNAAS